MGHCYIAGGTESMSMIPMTGYKFAPSYKVASSTPNYLVSMGITAEAVAEKYKVNREDADAFALRGVICRDGDLLVAGAPARTDRDARRRLFRLAIRGAAGDIGHRAWLFAHHAVAPAGREFAGTL